MEDRLVFMLLLRLTGNEGLDEEAGSGLSLKVSRKTLKVQSINAMSLPFYQPQGWSTCAAGTGGGQGQVTFSFLETSVHVQPL